jgi:hypothetical protein
VSSTQSSIALPLAILPAQFTHLPDQAPQLIENQWVGIDRPAVEQHRASMQTAPQRAPACTNPRSHQRHRRERARNSGSAHLSSYQLPLTIPAHSSSTSTPRPPATAKAPQPLPAPCAPLAPEHRSPRAEVTKLQGRLPQGQAMVMAVFGDGCGLVVTNRWGEGCDQHQAAGEQAPASRSVSLGGSGAPRHAWVAGSPLLLIRAEGGIVLRFD